MLWFCLKPRGPPQFNSFEASFHCTILSVKMQGTVCVSNLASKFWVMITSMENLCAFVTLTGTISCPVIFNRKSLNFNCYTYHWRVIFSTLQNCPTLLYWKHDFFNNFLFMSCSTRNWISGMVGSKMMFETSGWVYLHVMLFDFKDSRLVRIKDTFP